MQDNETDFLTNNGTEQADSLYSMGLEFSDTDYASHPSMSEGVEFADEKQLKDIKKAERLRIAGGFSCGVLFCVVLLLILTYLTDAGRIITGSQYKHYKELDDTYGKYHEIVRMLGEDPIAKKTPDEINDDMIRDLLAESGDPYAEYFTAEEYKRFTEIYKGSYTGIGVVVAETDKGTVVIDVMDGGPAEGADVHVGDIITAVDGKKVGNINSALDMIKGKTGTEVTITVDRDGESLEKTMKRDVIEQDSVSYDRVESDPEIGYIRIAAFHNKTSSEFEMAVKDLKGMGCTKFIIDLRGNGGGLTDESISIADYLLPECRIMTEIKKDGTEKVYNSKASSADLDYVVLTDANTASASEILAGAIQDNKDALIIGNKTYGKGVTQLTKKFKDGSAVKMTATEYLRPGGGKVDGIGIEPDIDTGDEDAMETAVRELKK